MGRRRTTRRRTPVPVSDAAAHGIERRETFRDRQFAVRPVAGGASTKTYRCPGCDHEIRPGTPHVVVWATADLDALDRRHWHTVCWRAREHRPVRGFR
ncbi:MAG: hypothetical protein ACR2JQ_00140 [Mycobacteriales bacterium]